MAVEGKHRRADFNFALELREYMYSESEPGARYSPIELGARGFALEWVLIL